MPRPPRTEEAKVAISAYYAEHGGMPTIEVFAKVMGYRSTSSAHNTVKALVREAFLAQEERGGRLLPGPQFVRPTAKQFTSVIPQIPPELAAVLPAGVELNVLEVPNDSLAEHAILVGDMLVLAPPARTDLSDQLLQQKGVVLAIAGSRKPGWRALGVLVAQFRKHS
jgi:SOS-response transcriptional repressor LexA